MGQNKIPSYMYVVIMGVLTVLICFVIADGLIGVEGAIRDYEDLGDGQYTYIVQTSNPIGRYIFWIGLIGLPILFFKKIRVRDTWLNIPIFLFSWYFCSWIFGEKGNHRYLAHPSKGFIDFGDGLESLSAVILLWGVQTIILLLIFFLCFAIKKLKQVDSAVIQRIISLKR